MPSPKLVPLVLSDAERELADWAGTVAAELVGYWPPGVTDRPADVWEPLLAIADAAGGLWPGRAHAACVYLLKDNADRGISLGVAWRSFLATTTRQLRPVMHCSGRPLL